MKRFHEARNQMVLFFFRIVCLTVKDRMQLSTMSKHSFFQMVSNTTPAAGILLLHIHCL